MFLRHAYAYAFFLINVLLYIHAYPNLFQKIKFLNMHKYSACWHIRQKPFVFFGYPKNVIS